MMSYRSLVLCGSGSLLFIIFFLKESGSVTSCSRYSCSRAGPLPGHHAES